MLGIEYIGDGAYVETSTKNHGPFVAGILPILREVQST